MVGFIFCGTRSEQVVTLLCYICPHLELEVCPILTDQICAFPSQTSLRVVVVETDPVQHSSSVFHLKLLSAELGTQSYYLVNYDVRGYLSWELRPFSVHCTTFVIIFPQQPFVTARTTFAFVIFPVFFSLPFKTSLRSPAQLNPLCS